MRKINIIFLFFFIVVLLGSCNKFDENNSFEKIDSKNFNEDGYFVSEGILYFNSSDDLYELGNKLSAITNEERISWEKQINFISLRSKIESVYNEISSIETEEEFKRIANKNTDILKIVDGKLQPVISSVFYPMITNREGFFIVNGTLHKVTSDGIYTDVDCCFEEIDLVAKGEKINDAIGFVPKSEIVLKSDDCGADDDEESDWNNDRMCFAKMMVERDYCKDACCEHSWWYKASAWSESWGRFIIEYQYNSFHYSSELEIQMSVPTDADFNGQTTTFTWDDFVLNNDIISASTDETVHYWWNGISVGDRVQLWSTSTSPPSPIPNPTMDKVKGDFWTRGSYPAKAEIDCGYGH